MPEIAVNLFEPHAEAAALIRGKPAVARQVFDGLLPELRARAITVTGLQRLDAVERIRESIATVAEGKTWDDAKAEITAELSALEDGAERRAELLLRTHSFQAFSASQWRSAQADRDTTHLQYLATEDDRVRPSHLALNGLIFPKTDSFWLKHTPPWEWGCRCRVRALSEDDVLEAMVKDQARNPEDRLVMNGPRAERARQGQLDRGTQTLPSGTKTPGGTFNITSPADKRTEKAPFQWHPDDLRLSVEDLKKRYTPEEWRDFEAWAKQTDSGRPQTVMEWLEGQPAPETTIENEERHLARLGHEVGVAFQSDGSPLARVQGDSDRVAG